MRPAKVRRHRPKEAPVRRRATIIPRPRDLAGLTQADGLMGAAAAKRRATLCSSAVILHFRWTKVGVPPPNRRLPPVDGKSGAGPRPTGLQTPRSVLAQALVPRPSLHDDRRTTPPAPARRGRW